MRKAKREEDASFRLVARGLEKGTTFSGTKGLGLGWLPYFFEKLRQVSDI